MKGKVIVTGLGLLLLMASIGSVSATSEIFYPNDQVEGGVGSYDYDINKDSGPAEDTTFDHDNYLGLSVEADNVKGPEEYGESDEETNIELFVGVTGHSEWYDEWVQSVIGYPPTIVNHYYHTKPVKLKVEASISNCDDGANPHINWIKSRNKGVNVGGDDQPDSYDDLNIPMNNTVKTTAGIIVGETPARIPLAAEEFTEAVNEDLSDTKYVMEKDGDSGPDANIIQKWDINKNQDDLVYEKRVIDEVQHTKDVGTMNFSASTGIHWEIPATYQNDCTINLKASLLMEHDQDGEITQKWGAVTNSVSLTIKNAEPELDEYDIAVTNEPVGASECGEEYYKLQPCIEISYGFLDNPADCLDAKYNVTIKYSEDGINWDTHYTHEGATIGWSKVIDENMYIDNQGTSGSVDLKFIVTAKDKYGGWEKGVTKTFDWQHKFELSIDAYPGGTTNPSPGTYLYDYGEEVTVEAEVEDADYYFEEWTGDVSSTSSTITVEMTEDKSIIAVFEEEGGTDPYSIEVEKDESYVQSFEKGSIPSEFLETLRERGLDDVDEEAGLSQGKNGWWITVDREKQYRIRERAEKLEIYAVEELRRT